MIVTLSGGVTEGEYVAILGRPAGSGKDWDEAGDGGSGNENFECSHYELGFLDRKMAQWTLIFDELG